MTHTLTPAAPLLPSSPLCSYMCVNNMYNFVPSCTGASRPVVGGRIAPGENYHSMRLIN